jgi:hypothetical protein
MSSSMPPTQIPSSQLHEGYTIDLSHVRLSDEIVIPILPPPAHLSPPSTSPEEFSNIEHSAAITYSSPHSTPLRERWYNPAPRVRAIRVWYTNLTPSSKKLICFDWLELPHMTGLLAIATLASFTLIVIGYMLKTGPGCCYQVSKGEGGTDYGGFGDGPADRPGQPMVMF